MLEGLESGIGLVSAELETLVSDFSVGDLVGNLVGFAAIFLGVWAVWIGIRAALRAARLLK